MPLPLHPASALYSLLASLLSQMPLSQHSYVQQLLQQIMLTVNRVSTRPHNKEQGACRVHRVISEIARHFRKHWLSPVSSVCPSGHNVWDTPCILIHYYSTSMVVYVKTGHFWHGVPRCDFSCFIVVSILQLLQCCLVELEKHRCLQFVHNVINQVHQIKNDSASLLPSNLTGSL